MLSAGRVGRDVLDAPRPCVTCLPRFATPSHLSSLLRPSRLSRLPNASRAAEDGRPYRNTPSHTFGPIPPRKRPEDIYFIPSYGRVSVGGRGRPPLPKCAASALAGGGGGASSSMLRVTLRKVWIAEDAVQSSLSPSGEISRVAAVLELRPPPARLAPPPPPAPCPAPSTKHSSPTLASARHPHGRNVSRS